LTTASNTSSYDDEKLLVQLVNVFVSIAIEDWGDNLADQFETEIATAISRINAYKEDAETNAKECKVAISLSDAKIEKTFSASDISPLGSTLLSNLRSVFNEYNESITTDEQLAIITKLIEDVIN
jgi:tRNA threonylcarbamoyladenosine modification (KEOPS) complex  Pcc1 subunit